MVYLALQFYLYLCMELDMPLVGIVLTLEELKKLGYNSDSIRYQLRRQ